MEPWPTTIGTSRLLLRPARCSDASAFTRLWTDPEVRRFLGGPVGQRQLPAYQRHFADRPHTFAVATGEDATAVGLVSIDPASRFDGRREVSYALLPEYWGQGYGREAVAAVVDWALGAVPSDSPSVIAVTQEANLRSRRLLESLGMRHIDSFTEWGAPQAMYCVDRQGLCVGH